MNQLFGRKFSKEDFSELQDEFLKVKNKFEEVCKLLNIGFSADTYDPSAHFIVNDKDKK